jgi:periplasmic divalent cation tolerance protein
MDNLIMVYVTIGNPEDAKILVCNLLEKQFIACANIFPIESLYVWENKQVNDQEYVIIMKTLASRYTDLEKEILHNHPYEVPCIVKIGTQCNQSFLDFVTRAVK